MVNVNLMPCISYLKTTQFMSGISIVTLAIYFITSSDSGSLIVDILSSNGSEKHYWAQRVFWAFTEGAVATGLLVAGGSDALGALQTASLVFGLPFNFFIFFMCYSVYKMCLALEEHESGQDMDPALLLPKKTWEMPVFGGIFDIFEFMFSFGKVHKGLGVSFPTRKHFVGFAKNLVAPFLSLRSTYSAIDLKDQHKVSNILATASYTACHCAWIALFICSTINDGFVAFAWSAFFINACILTYLRADFRGKYGIGGNIVGDFIASSFLYPNALLQMELHLAEEAEREHVGEAEVLVSHDHQA